MENFSLQSLRKKFTKEQLALLDKDDFRRIAREWADIYLQVDFWVDISPIIEKILQEKLQRKEVI